MVSRKGNAQKGATMEDIMGRGSSKAGKGGAGKAGSARVASQGGG